MGTGEKPTSHVVTIRLRLWSRNTQPHWYILGNHTQYPPNYLTRDGGGGLCNQTVIVTGWGLSLGAWTPWHFWAALCGWSPQAENQRDTGACLTWELSVATGTVCPLWESSEVDKRAMGGTPTVQLSPQSPPLVITQTPTFFCVLLISSRISLVFTCLFIHYSTYSISNTDSTPLLNRIHIFPFDQYCLKDKRNLSLI